MKRVLMMTMAAALLGGCAVKNQGHPQPRRRSRSRPSSRVKATPTSASTRSPAWICASTILVLLDPLQFIRQENGQWYLLTANEQNEIGPLPRHLPAELMSHGVKMATEPGPG